MAPSLKDLLAGDPPAELLLRATDTPLVEPYSLDNLDEPDWYDYEPSFFEIEQQTFDASGWAFFVGNGYFNVLENDEPAPLTGLFLTAEESGITYLIAVIDLAGKPGADLRIGTNLFQVSFSAFVGLGA